MDKNVDLYAKTTNIHMEKSIFVICDKPCKHAGAQQFIPMATCIGNLCYDISIGGPYVLIHHAWTCIFS